MNPYIAQLAKEISDYQAKCGIEEDAAILDILWYCYRASNPVDDGQIEASEQLLTPVFRELSVENSDILFDLISDLCLAYQRSAFLEGIQVGFHLSSELDCTQ